MIVMLRFANFSPHTHTQTRKDKDKTQNPNKEMCCSDSRLAARRRPALLNWPEARPLPHMSEAAALDGAHQAAGFISNKSTSSRIRCSCLRASEWIWFFFRSGWQTSGVGRLGWKSHHCAVGLEERGEAVGHAVSTRWLECSRHCWAPVRFSLFLSKYCFRGGRNLHFKSFISGSSSCSAIFFSVALWQDR